MVVEHVLRILDDGRRTGTHKLVLLLAVMDGLEDAAAHRGASPASIPVRAIARPVMRIMWQQVAPFVPPGRGDATELRQMRPNGRGGYRFWELTREARQVAERDGLADLDALAAADPGLVARLEDDLVAAAVKNPVPRLQRFGGDPVEFLYRWPWGEDRSPRVVAREQGRTDGEPQLEFVAGAPDELLRLGPVLRPVVTDRIVDDVTTYNNLHTSAEAVRDHLFSAERRAVPARLRDALRELQYDRCGYCEAPLGRRTEVDHFVPWVWRPNNAVENLVLADRRCNNAKRDRFASHEHVARWVDGLAARSDVGRRLGPDVGGVYTDPARSVGIVRRSYAQLDRRRRLWVGPGHELRPADDRELEAVARSLRGAVGDTRRTSRHGDRPDLPRVAAEDRRGPLR